MFCNFIHCFANPSEIWQSYAEINNSEYWLLFQVLIIIPSFVKLFRAVTLFKYFLCFETFQSIVIRSLKNFFSNCSWRWLSNNKLGQTWNWLRPPSDHYSMEPFGFTCDTCKRLFVMLQAVLATKQWTFPLIH